MEWDGEDSTVGEETPCGNATSLLRHTVALPRHARSETIKRAISHMVRGLLTPRLDDRERWRGCIARHHAAGPSSFGAVRLPAHRAIDLPGVYQTLSITSTSTMVMVSIRSQHSEKEHDCNNDRLGTTLQEAARCFGLWERGARLYESRIRVSEACKASERPTGRAAAPP